MDAEIRGYCDLIRERIHGDYTGMFRDAGGFLEHPFITPGSASYHDVLWDWDSWLSNVALRQILLEHGTADAREEAVAYERGCILNFLRFGAGDGWIPICIGRDEGGLVSERPANIYKENMHKPCLAQHAAFLVRLADGDAEWLRERFLSLQCFLNAYRNHHRTPFGLYYWQTDLAIGVDNDPCVFYRPPGSCGAIYLNCLMYRELQAMAYLCDRLNLDAVARHYRDDAADLRAAVLAHCWDERDGFFYNVDLNLLPVEHKPGLHAGFPRHYDCLIMRIGVWSGFLALWAGIAEPEMAERVVLEHYRNPDTFNAAYGVRTLSRLEKMYNLRGSGNPSSWQGPVWGISNYMTFRGLVNYGFEDEARELAEKTIRLFGRDFARFGALHEYYQPDNGEPILNRGFQNWNYLVLNMIAWYQGREAVVEYQGEEA